MLWKIASNSIQWSMWAWKMNYYLYSVALTCMFIYVCGVECGNWSHLTSNNQDWNMKTTLQKKPEQACTELYENYKEFFDRCLVGYFILRFKVSWPSLVPRESILWCPEGDCDCFYLFHKTWHNRDLRITGNLTTNIVFCWFWLHSVD